MGPGSTYNLEEVKSLVRSGARRITTDAQKRAAELDYRREDVYNIVLRLEDSDFYKTMPATHAAGLFQDVYHFRDGNTELYVKVQIVNEAAETDKSEKVVAKVISFKLSGSP